MASAGPLHLRLRNIIQPILRDGRNAPASSVSVAAATSVVGADILSRLFDAAWYLGRYPDVAAAKIEPFDHFIKTGLREGCLPTPYFDEPWYSERYGELIPAGMRPFEHFIRQGLAAGLDPHPLFSSRWYQAHNADLADSGISPFEHFLLQGGTADRNPHPLFDAAWYLGRYPDVAAARIEPFGHFINTGLREGRVPTPYFDEPWYMSMNPDVRTAPVGAFDHFVRSGAFEGRNFHPMFDVRLFLSLYRSQSRAVRKIGVRTTSSIEEYLLSCETCDLWFHPLVNPRFYRRALGISEPTNLFSLVLKEKFVSPNPFFHFSEYHKYEDLAQEGPVHYARRGRHEGRQTSALMIDEGKTGLDLVNLLDPYRNGIPDREIHPVAALREMARHDPRLPGRISILHPSALIGTSNLCGAEHGGVALLIHSQGNFYMAELARLLQAGLIRLGVPAVVLTERSRLPEYNWRLVVVAPHEFFYWDSGKARLPELLKRGFSVVTTEQPYSRWFLLSLPYLSLADHVFDVTFQVAGYLKSLGFSAHFLCLGYLDNYPLYGPKPSMLGFDLLASYGADVIHYDCGRESGLFERPLDFLFCGARTPYRDVQFARLQPVLSSLKGIHLLVDHFAPVTPADALSKNGTGAVFDIGVSQRSKAIINVHRTEYPFFEWHRLALHGIWNGTAILTEHCMPTSIFSPGSDYLEEVPRLMPELVQWAFTTEEGREQLRQVARQGLQTLKSHPITRYLAHMMHVLNDKGERKACGTGIARS